MAASLPSVQELEVDFQTITLEIERLTGLKSRWNGRVYISDSLRYQGAKRWDCSVELARSILATQRRYSTSVHEALHSVSVGLDETSYAAYQGYEEAVVEQCTRLLRKEALAPLNLKEPLEERVSYAGEIAALEALRTYTNKDERAFYLELLKTPLQNREQTVIQWIAAADTGKNQLQIIQATAAIRARLRP